MIIHTCYLFVHTVITVINLDIKEAKSVGKTIWQSLLKKKLKNKFSGLPTLIFLDMSL